MDDLYEAVTTHARETAARVKRDRWIQRLIDRLRKRGAKQMSDDWRIQGQERYLHGATLVRKQYKAPRADWDHDHCEFCWAKFSKCVNELEVGYATLDERHWICETCFRDFQERFGWTVQDCGR